MLIPYAVVQLAASSTEDPVAAVFGAPTTAVELNTLTGLTALSPTPDYEAIVGNTYLVLRDDASAVSICGRYVSAPSAPFTAIAKITEAQVYAEFMQAGMFIGEGTPGALDFWRLIFVVSMGGREIALSRYTNPTTFSSTVYESGNLAELFIPPLYLAIRANSSTDVDYLFSYGGVSWVKAVDSRNPGITLGSIGVAINAQTASGVLASFDFLRIWNSALSMPGAAA